MQHALHHHRDHIDHHIDHHRDHHRDHPDRWLTHRFAPITLDALNAKAAMLERLDNKYVLRAPVLSVAAPRLETLFDVLEIDGRRSFTYETCYFDNPQRRSYFDHHQGRRQRMKVRVRHYVDAGPSVAPGRPKPLTAPSGGSERSERGGLYSVAPGRPKPLTAPSGGSERSERGGLYFLEVKLKDKRGVTLKRRMPVDASQFGRLDAPARAFVAAAWRDLYGCEYGCDDDGAYGHEPSRLEPVLQMSYRRITLVAREGGERMTIDTGIHFLRAWGAREARRTDDAIFIVETKSARGRGIADAVLREQHQHPVEGCSKYCVGMSLTGAVQRWNRFRPALRLLGAWPRALHAPHAAARDALVGAGR